MCVVAIHTHPLNGRTVYTVIPTAAEGKDSLLHRSWLDPLCLFPMGSYKNPAVCRHLKFSLKSQWIWWEQSWRRRGYPSSCSPHESISRIGPRHFWMSADVSPLPGHRGFRSSLPNLASHGGPSASLHILAPAAFPADGAVDTQSGSIHRVNELHPDKPHKARTLRRRKNVELVALFHEPALVIGRWCLCGRT